MHIVNSLFRNLLDPSSSGVDICIGFSGLEAAVLFRMGSQCLGRLSIINTEKKRRRESGTNSSYEVYQGCSPLRLILLFS
jgi:hypothetical protein